MAQSALFIVFLSVYVSSQEPELERHRNSSDSRGFSNPRTQYHLSAEEKGCDIVKLVNLVSGFSFMLSILCLAKQAIECNDSKQGKLRWGFVYLCRISIFDSLEGCCFHFFAEVHRFFATWLTEVLKI